ncbi:MAG TPA: GntR family transcriptional regulator [Crocinitomix sp.]|nr:GntR family transcriptional regulator [Crocinitomix sp.]
MLKIGKVNKLRIVKEVDFGMYLDGGENFGEILLPARYITPSCVVDEEVDVFIYLDSEDRLIATTDFPFAMVDDIALLEVVANTKVGAFVDWGLMKDLLIPFKEQHRELLVGDKVVVKIYIDDLTERIVASAKLDQFLDNTPPEFDYNEEVDLFVHSKTDLGYRMVVNGLHWGLVYENEVFKPLSRGQKLKGYVKLIREDDKIDISLQKQGYVAAIDDASQTVLEKLKQNNGELEVGDKSSPEVINHLFGMSKKSFKKAIGNLYKQKIISIESDRIKLL